MSSSGVQSPFCADWRLCPVSILFWIRTDASGFYSVLNTGFYSVLNSWVSLILLQGDSCSVGICMLVVVFRFALWQLQQQILTLFDLLKVFGVLTVIDWLVLVLWFLFLIPSGFRRQWHHTTTGLEVDGLAAEPDQWSDIQTVESEVRADRSSPAEPRP